MEIKKITIWGLCILIFAQTSDWFARFKSVFSDWIGGYEASHFTHKTLFIIPQYSHSWFLEPFFRTNFVSKCNYYEQEKIKENYIHVFFLKHRLSFNFYYRAPLYIKAKT